MCAASYPNCIQSAAPGLLGGSRMQYHLRMALTFLDAATFGTPEIFVGSAHMKFHKDTLELHDEATRKIIGMQLEAFEKHIEKMK